MVLNLIPDVDIDLADPGAAMQVVPGLTRASQFNVAKDELVQHSTGAYLQKIPVDPVTGLAAFPYDVAEDLGYFKVDFIKNHIYTGLTNEDIEAMLEFGEGPEFPWDWFEDEAFYGDQGLAHIGRYHHIVMQYPPRSVTDLAAIIALIRPRKSYLIGEPRDFVMDNIWINHPEEETDKPGVYFFKKSHAVAYALMILIHIQVLKLLAESE